MSWYDDLTKPVTRAPKERVTPPQAFKEHNSTKPTATALTGQKRDQIDALRTTKAWELATAPAKQIPMNLFMSYMSGNSLQVIPITMTLMLFSTTFSALLSVNKVFTGLESERTKQDIMMCKATYLACHICVLAIGVWKLNAMGLIPNGTGDWLSWEEPPMYIERVL